jgi:hypothetical protein
LLNNLAFSLATSGRLDEARDVVNTALPDVSKRDNAVMTATRGLIAYRGGDPAAGRVLYRSAIEQLVKEKEAVAAASATLFWVYEELCSGGDGLEDALKLAVSTNRGVRSEDLTLPRRRLERLARQIEPSAIRAISGLDVDRRAHRSVS